MLTALAAAMNIVGNVAGGRLLQRGVAPERLLRWGFVAMALGSVAAFAPVGGRARSEPAAGAALRSRCACSRWRRDGAGHAVHAGRAAGAGPSTVSTTVGLMQQASSLGQFVAPPLVAWVAHRAGGWQWTWVVTLRLFAGGHRRWRLRLWPAAAVRAPEHGRGTAARSEGP